MKNLIIVVTALLSIAAAGCLSDNPGPEITGPEPPSPIKFVARDSIFEGNYRGISINSPTNEVFSVLEKYREQKVVTYQNAVNNYFSDVTELKDRINLFQYIVLDEKTDTDSGVQLELESGKVKSITLNNRRVLIQWPEKAGTTEAVRIGDESGALYSKLLALSKQTEFAQKFQKIVLLTKYTYAVYDPEKASMPWNFIYWTQPDLGEEVQVHFKDGKVQYITINRFEKQ